MRKTILFDIDGTLLHAQGLGRPVFASAFQTAYGLNYPKMKSVSFVGATDSGVIRGMAAECGLESTPAREEHFYQILARDLDALLAQQPPKLYPGVTDLIRTLSDTYTLGLVTGNIRSTAWSKLRHAGLDRYFTFGAYGDEHELRGDIARAAVARAPHTPFLLVGDTPSDVEAAKAAGLKSLIVMTGWVTRESVADADYILDDFSDVAAAVELIRIAAE